MGSSAMELLSLDNPVFRGYMFYSCILVVKMLAMVPLTARHRYAKKIFASPEDTKLLPGAKVSTTDPDIERVRRAHRNDMENIYIYFVASFCYMMTNPSPFFAIMLFRLYTLARIVHTFVYAVVVIPQPARGLAFGVGFAITAYMAVVSILTFA